MCLVKKSEQEEIIHLLPRHFSFVRVDDILHIYICVTWKAVTAEEGFRTLIMTTRVDWKSEGLDAGSNTDELDWKD